MSGTPVSHMLAIGSVEKEGGGTGATKRRQDQEMQSRCNYNRNKAKATARDARRRWDAEIGKKKHKRHKRGTIEESM